MKTLLQLVRQECANHDNESHKIKDYCCISKTDDHKCIYVLDENSRCGYFEECVLPLDKELEAIYYAEKKAQIENRELSNKERKKIKEQNKPEEKKKKKNRKYGLKKM
jgi:hypothetical protein